MIIDAVTKRGLDGSMIDEKCRDLDAVRFVDDPLPNIGRDDFDSF